MKISISMIALNEERFIARALSSCGFADEVVVVDGGSTDRTVEILQSHPKVKVIRHPWQGHFGQQRQISLQHCSGDWVIRLDADEAFSLAFETEISALLDRTAEEVQAYRVKQCNLVGNEHYYSKGADKFETTPRIWRNGSSTRWKLAIHETLSGITGNVLDWDIYVVHYGFLDKSNFLKKGENYTRIEGSQVSKAEDLVYRNYDFQPVPDRAKVGPHVHPYTVDRRRSHKPQVAVIRGPHLNLWEMQLYRPLQRIYDLTLFTSCEIPSQWPETGIPIVRLPEDKSVHTAMEGMEYALFDTDIVFVSQIVWPYSYQAIKAKEKFRKKVVALQWDITPFAWENQKTLEFFKKTNRALVDVFVADTVCAKNALLIEGVPREKIVVIPTGVNVNEWSPDKVIRTRIRKQLGISDSEKVLLFPENRNHDNGISDLIHAAKLLQSLNSNAASEVKHIIVGKAGETQAITEIIETMGLDDKFVYCTGLTLYELFNAADMLFLGRLPEASWQEPPHMILRKALAFGLPIIAGASESIPDIVGDAGLLIPDNNPGALCAAIVELVDDNRRSTLSKRAKNRAMTQFPIEKTVRELTNLFQMVHQSIHPE